jgi:peptidoglycan/xylan/chitin deacetylase (PgdA/CDA1 family)
MVNVLNYGCSYDQEYADALLHAYNAGMQICSHTSTHADLNKLTYAQIDQEVEQVETMLHKIIGAVPACIRAPYGSISQKVVDYLNNKHGLVVVNWTYDSGDSVGKSEKQSEAVYKKIKAPMKAIVLNHETEKTTAKTLFPAAIKIAKQNGYTSANFMTIAQSLAFNPYKSVTTPVSLDPLCAMLHWLTSLFAIRESVTKHGLVRLPKS